MIRNNSYMELVEEAYVCCEGFDFLWDKKEIPRFREMWKSGLSIYQIAEEFKRKPQEVLFLIIDKYDMKEIHQRPGGIWGGEYVDSIRSTRGAGGPGETKSNNNKRTRKNVRSKKVEGL